MAILGITHPPKSPSGRAKDWFIGSLAFIAAARSGFIVLSDREDPERRLFLQAKNNLARKTKGLAYHIVERVLPQGVKSTCVEWEKDYIDVTADEAIRAEQGHGPSKLEAAKKFVRSALANGPMLSTKSEKRARTMEITKRTLMRAREELGVVATKLQDGSWLCSLPPGTNNNAE